MTAPAGQGVAAIFAKHLATEPQSNQIIFEYDQPSISAIDGHINVPVTGGSFLTIHGENFGLSVSIMYVFANKLLSLLLQFITFSSQGGQ